MGGLESSREALEAGGVGGEGSQQTPALARRRTGRVMQRGGRARIRTEVGAAVAHVSVRPAARSSMSSSSSSGGGSLS